MLEQGAKRPTRVACADCPKVPDGRGRESPGEAWRNGESDGIDTASERSLWYALSSQSAIRTPRTRRRSTSRN